MRLTSAKPVEVKPRLRPPPSFAGLLIRITIARLLAGIAWYAVPVLGLVGAFAMVLWFLFDWNAPHAHQ